MRRRAGGTVKRDWNDLGIVDPYWAVLTDPSGKGGAWDPEAFFQSGAGSVEELVREAAELGLPRNWAGALDFGCGLGRVTRALAPRFDHILALDISPSMVAQARALNPDLGNVDFRESSDAVLAGLRDRTFDLVYCAIVLQHQPSRQAIRRYLTEFVRMTTDDGLVVFQLPTHIPVRHRVQPRRRLYDLLRGVGVTPSLLYSRLGLDPICMTAMPPDEVMRVVQGAGGLVIRQRDDASGAAFASRTYFVTPARRRRGAPAGVL